MNIQNVASFRGFTVTKGQIDISNDEYKEFLNDVYGDVTICGMTYSQGDALEAPTLGGRITHDGFPLRFCPL